MASESSTAVAAVTGPISGPQSVEAVPLPAVGAASSDIAAKYRGATVEDLQLSPAVCVYRSASIEKALSVAHDHDYSQLPLVGQSRKLLGYVDVGNLKERLEKGQSSSTDPVDTAMTSFASAAKQQGGKSKFTIITPQTELADLEGERQSSF